MAQQEPQELFAGKFRLLRMLGRGAMGEVWLAVEEGPSNFTRQVALKRLLSTEGMSDYARQSFVAEAQVIARLDHPNIVRLIELGESDDRGLYLVLDYIDGSALDRIIRRGGALSPAAVALMGREVARALDAVHSMCDALGNNLGVVHRDVSPANILIGRDGRVRLSDFGVARITGLGGEKTETGVFKGKLPYMPPEQALGEPFDGRADVFSLGITIFESLLGGRLRTAETQGQLIAMIATEPVPRVREVVDGAPPALAAAIDAATEFRSNRRIASAGQLATALHEVLFALGPGAEEAATHELRQRVVLAAGSASATTRAPWSLPMAGAAAEDPTARAGGSKSAHQTPSSRPGMSGTQPSVTRVASIRDAQPVTSRGGTSRTVIYMLCAFIIACCGATAAWLLLVPAPPRVEEQAALEERAAADAPGAAGTKPAAVAPSADASAQPVASAGQDGIASADADATPASSAAVPVPTVAGTVALPRSSNTTGAEPSTGNGSLTVVVNPWGNVTVDGKSYGATPLPPISLSPGPHSVVVTNPEIGASRGGTARIQPGKPLTMKFDLKKND
jgi:serine/threonine-protein kinase